MLIWWFYESEGVLFKFNLRVKLAKVTRGVKIATSGFKLIVCLCVIYMREDNDPSVSDMITRLICFTWTPMCTIPERPLGWLAGWLAYSLTHSLNRSPARPLAHSPTPTPTPTHTITHSLTRSLTHSLTHSRIHPRTEDQISAEMHLHCMWMSHSV